MLKRNVIGLLAYMKKSIMTMMAAVSVALPVWGQGAEVPELKQAVEIVQDRYKHGAASYVEVLEAQAAVLRAQIAAQHGADAAARESLLANYEEQLRAANATHDKEKALEVRQRQLSLRSGDYAALTAPYELKDIALLREQVEYRHSLYKSASASALGYLQALTALKRVEAEQGLASPAEALEAEARLLEMRMITEPKYASALRILLAGNYEEQIRLAKAAGDTSKADALTRLLQNLRSH